MRRLITTTTALLAMATPLLAAAPSHAAPPDVTIKPGTLPRGPDVSGAHLQGKTIVDGDVRVTVKAPRVLLYGKSNDVYVVATGDKEWGNTKLLQVRPSGATKQLAKFIDPFNTQLDADGGQVAYSYGDSISKPTIAVYDLALKDEVSVNAFASLPKLLDFDEGSVVASFADFKVKTIQWDTVSDETVRLTVRKGLEQYGVDDSKDRRVSAQPERNSNDNRQRKPRILPQQAEAVFEVLQYSFEHVSCSPVLVRWNHRHCERNSKLTILFYQHQRVVK